MDDALLEIFREESLERVDRIAATLLAAEAGGSGGAETIAQLLRDAHSIKGSAGMFGLDKVGALAGAMEDVLARSRERGELEPRAIPALLGGADAIRAAVTDDPQRVGPAADALAALGADDAPAPPTRAAPPTPTPPTRAAPPTLPPRAVPTPPPRRATLPPRAEPAAPVRSTPSARPTATPTSTARPTTPPAPAARPTTPPARPAPTPTPAAGSTPPPAPPARPAPAAGGADPGPRASLPGAPGVATAVPAAEPSPTHSAIERTLRVRADKVDRLLASVGETALHNRRIEHMTTRDGTAGEALADELDRGRTLVADLQDAVLDLRTLPLQTVVGGLTRAVRDSAAEVGREVRLELSGTDTPLDRTILDGIGDALIHLLRNAISHGIEPPEERERLGKPRAGHVRIDAEQRGGMVALTCADDGRGVARELLDRVQPGETLADLLAQAGFSTAGAVSDLSGRGVGLDAVKRHVEGLGGMLEVASTPGEGTAVTLLVPLTLAVITVLLFERGRQVFGIPLAGVERAVRGGRDHILHGRRSLELDGETLPLTDLADSLGMDAPAFAESTPVIVVSSGSQRAAVECDALLGDQEVVVKSLGPLLAAVPGYIGGAILDDGGIALLLDPAYLVRTAEVSPRERRAAQERAGEGPATVLVVDDQFTVRELERTILEAAGYRVRTAEDGRAALAVLDEDGRVDCVVSDVEMPRMNGLELLEEIRSRPQLATLPVVVVTSRADEEALARGADAGADAWVVKSQFEQQALLETIGRLIGPR